MFYDKQPKDKQEAYKNMLSIVGSLSKLFSDSVSPYLYYRAHENIFAKYFNVTNNARSDDSADAYDLINKIGIGLKTWVGQDTQKVAEFGKLRPEYENLRGIELIRKIAFYRNERIRITKNSHSLQSMVYHIIKRIPGYMCIYEAAFSSIDIDHIQLIPGRGNANNTYFTDGKHTYTFSLSKNTLYMVFDTMELLDSFPVSILDDPYDFLSSLSKNNNQVINLVNQSVPDDNKLCLRLYSSLKDGRKFVPEKSGLNQWNGFRRSFKRNSLGETTEIKETRRNPNELYIPFPKEDRERKTDFFPPRDEPFELLLPDGTKLQAKVCQDDGKAIMSNPNKDLGKWLLRDVFELPEGVAVTYDMLMVFGIDSVMFTRLGERVYSIDFCELGTYENFYQIGGSEGSEESDKDKPE